MTKFCPSGSGLYRGCDLASGAGCCRDWEPERVLFSYNGLTIVPLNIRSLSVISKIEQSGWFVTIKIYLYKVWLGGNSPWVCVFCTSCKRRRRHLFFPDYFSRIFVLRVLEDIDSSPLQREAQVCLQLSTSKLMWAFRKKCGEFAL